MYIFKGEPFLRALGVAEEGEAVPTFYHRRVKT